MPTATETPPSPTPTLDPEWVRPEVGAQVPRITVDELAELLALERPVILIDARGTNAFSQAHIPGALDIPAGQIGDAAPQWPKGARIVLYCT
jgi:rhodanese-related sulfurtransferase